MYAKILVPVDGSKTAARAVNEAIDLAIALKSEVRVISVVDNSDRFFDVGYYDPLALHTQMVDEAKRVLGEALALLTDKGIEADRQLVEDPIAPGDISGTILRHGAIWGAHVIVVGTHGRRGVRRLVMGSVAEGIVRKAHIPILLIHTDVPD